jgi:hypothetical protein
LFCVGKYDTRSDLNTHTNINHSYYLHPSNQYPNSYANAYSNAYSHPNSYVHHRDCNTNPNGDCNTNPNGDCNTNPDRESFPRVVNRYLDRNNITRSTCTWYFIRHH